ncbi:MAG: hypothetical protein JST04_17890 [Bdellovibrionales bacterium]|nr:hypothetical protein [Bdellovibrionales bacterium]
MTKPRFLELDHATWRALYAAQREAIARSIHPLFARGLEALGIGSDRIPELAEVNRRLVDRTGFCGRYVEGFESPIEFFAMLADGEFPIGAFIRDARDLGYTPAPDVFHDLFGHLPFLADPEYAEFTREFGRQALDHRHDPKRLLEFDRVYWYSAEFGLIRTPEGLRILGAGLASSTKETVHALDGSARVFPFLLDRVRRRSFHIDRMQSSLFAFSSLDELYRIPRELAARFESTEVPCRRRRIPRVPAFSKTRSSSG